MNTQCDGRAGARRHADVIGNRVYPAWGVGDNGVMQILDGAKLLPPTSGGGRCRPPDTSVGRGSESPPSIGILYMSPGSGRPHQHAGVRDEAEEL